MTQTTTQSYNQQSSEFTVKTQIPFDGINEPGAYVCNWSGHLLRVPEDGFTAGRSPVVNIVGREPLYVTKISENPYVTLTKAKLLAANFDLHVNW